MKATNEGTMSSSGSRAQDEADVVLRDGSTVRVRSVRAGDEEAILAFLQSLSDRSIYFRFFSGGVNLRRVATWAARLDSSERFGLVATAGLDQRVVAHAMYIRADGDRADVGIEVGDDYQGRGLGTILLGQLAEAAHDAGITIFQAEVLPSNRRMIDVLRDSGFPTETRSEPGVVHVEYPTSLAPEAIERFEARERSAAVAAVRSFLMPRSIAVIGAGRTRGTISGELFHNILATGFCGPVYPVNPKADVVQSVVAYHSVEDIPGPVDLAVIVVPARDVLGVARGCALKGVRALVVISSGFSEVGGEGVALQRELLDLCRNTGMRLIGPNCMGIVNTAPDVQLNATFAPSFPPHGRVAFLSQSGALALAVMDHAAALGLGLSSYVSVGNKADISGNDLIQYWEADEDTDLILLYLESFGNARKFARIARRVGKRKPIIAVKSGRSAAGARATSSHTGAMLAASDVTVDALFRHAGVIRTDTLGELFDVASLLARRSPPRGDRIAIVTNAGGPGILCADACEAEKLSIPAFPAGVRAQLDAFLPPQASTANPVDMIASATAEDFRNAVEVIGRSDAVDAIVVIFAPPLVTRAEDVATAIIQANAALEDRVPIVAVFMGARGAPDVISRPDAGIASFRFPEDAARALARAVRYEMWRARPEGTLRVFDDVQRDDVAALLSDVLASGPRWLAPHEVAHMFDAYRIPFARWTVAATPTAAGKVAGVETGPVALKAVAPTLQHKSDVGGVRIGLIGARAVQRAAAEMRGRVEGSGHHLDGFLVQPMVSGGVEMFIGVVSDPVFGPVLACGAGGTAVELLHDVQARITPLTDVDASEMLRALSTFPLLDGYRDAPKTDVASLEELLLRVSALVDTHHEIAELDLNPVMVSPQGSIVVDARIRVEAPPPRLPLSARNRG